MKTIVMSERFHKAARNGITDVLKETTKRDCNLKDEDGMTPTLWAAFEGNLEALRLLIARGGDPDKSDNFGNTALHYTAERGHASCVRFLVNFGANLWSLNCQMHTPKELAAMNSRADILRFLDEAMAEQEATKRKEVKIKKEKAQKEAEKKVKEYDKVQKKAEKIAEKEQKRLEKEREKMGGDCTLSQISSRPSTVFCVLKNKTGVGSLSSRGVTAPSPRFSEIVGTVTEANAKKFGIGAVQKKIHPKIFGSKCDSIGNGDFKVVEIEDGKKSVKNLTGLQRDSEILYVGTYDKEKQAVGNRRKLADVFHKNEEITCSGSLKNKDDGFLNGNKFLEPASLLERPGFGSFAVRNSITATLNALPIPGEENEVKENKGDESSIGSAGSLAKRHFLRVGVINSQWNSDGVNNEDCDVGNVDDVDSLEDDESSPLQLFLISHGLGEYINSFITEKIDLESLLLLTDEDLITLGLPLGPRRKLMTAINDRRKAIEEPGEVLDSQL